MISLPCLLNAMITNMYQCVYLLIPEMGGCKEWTDTMHAEQTTQSLAHYNSSATAVAFPMFAQLANMVHTIATRIFYFTVREMTVNWYLVNRAAHFISLKDAVHLQYAVRVSQDSNRQHCQ